MVKQALVTGATSSIGIALARELSKNGYELVLHFNENEDVLASSFPDHPRLKGDFSTGAGITAFVDAAVGAGPFDVIVTAAAVQGRVDESSIDAWQRVFNVNALAPAFLMAHAASLLRIPGQIVNISSALGEERFGSSTLVPYSASKAALNSMTRTFAKKLAPGIRVNGIAPGYVLSAWNRNRSEAARAELGRAQLIERLIGPQEVADLMMQIIENGAFAGEVVALDGGINLRSI
jgi:NAD(P)-dependent dehydrogenase (short-subunit alcohol dehydrogenase family)